MNEIRILMDPTPEKSSSWRQRLPRPASLDGLTIGLLDISKPQGNIFLDQLETHLVQRGLKVNRYSKPTFTRVAPVKLKQTIVSECDLVIEALAD